MKRVMQFVLNEFGLTAFNVPAGSTLIHIGIESGLARAYFEVKEEDWARTTDEVSVDHWVIEPVHTATDEIPRDGAYLGTVAIDEIGGTAKVIHFYAHPQ